MPSILDNVEVVLLATAEPMNLGAAARAMKNCGLSRLTLVSPKTDDFVTARRVAVHAEELLTPPRVVSTLEEALADVVWAVGTSSRGLPEQTPLSPRESAALAARHATSGRVALVFGGETSGLSNAELARCHATSRIPANDAQPSFNLAQAVMLYAYEVQLAAAEPSLAPASERATGRDLQGIEAVLRDVLVASGFADPDRPRHGVAELAACLRRSGPTPAEARLWNAALHGVLKALRGRGGSRE